MAEKSFRMWWNVAERRGMDLKQMKFEKIVEINIKW